LYSHLANRERRFFAFAVQEPGDDLSRACGRCWLAVGDDRFPLPFERDAAEPCGQWLPARPFLACLEAGPGPVPDGDRGPGVGLKETKRVVDGLKSCEDQRDFEYLTDNKSLIIPAVPLTLV
jgi:hypothetical protein